MIMKDYLWYIDWLLKEFLNILLNENSNPDLKSARGNPAKQALPCYLYQKV